MIVCESTLSARHPRCIGVLSLFDSRPRPLAPLRVGVGSNREHVISRDEGFAVLGLLRIWRRGAINGSVGKDLRHQHLLGKAVTDFVFRPNFLDC